MYLELADNNDDMYLQDNNNDMYLQDNNNGMYLQDHNKHMAQENTDSAYIYVPELNEGEGGYVREDFFDYLTDAQWNATMDYLEMQSPNMSFIGIGKKGRARRADRRAIRQESSMAKITARAEGTGGVGGALAGVAELAKSVMGGTPAPMMVAPGAGVIDPIRAAEAKKEEEEVAKEKKKKMQRNLLIGAGVLVIGVGVVVATTRKKKLNGNRR